MYIYIVFTKSTYNDVTIYLYRADVSRNLSSSMFLQNNISCKQYLYAYSVLTKQRVLTSLSMSILCLQNNGLCRQPIALLYSCCYAHRTISFSIPHSAYIVLTKTCARRKKHHLDTHRNEMCLQIITFITFSPCWQLAFAQPLLRTETNWGKGLNQVIVISPGEVIFF